MAGLSHRGLRSPSLGPRAFLSLLGTLVVAGALGFELAGRRGQFTDALHSAPIWIVAVAVLLQVIGLLARTEARHVCVRVTGATVTRRLFDWRAVRRRVRSAFRRVLGVRCRMALRAVTALLMAAGLLILLSAPAAEASSARRTRQLGAGVAVAQTDVNLSQYLSPQPGIALSTTQPPGVLVIDVDEAVRYQQLSGIGAAMTDSSAWLIHNELSAGVRSSLMEDLFGSAGIHLNFLRVPIGASDFTVSAQPYTYDDVPPGQTDPSLSRFSIAHDLAYILPTLRQALQLDPRLQVLANPWSPPAWMKANRSLDNISGQGTLLPSAYTPLASYFVRFIKAYANHGVPIAAITPQNEPGSGTSGASYPGLELPEADEANLIVQDLQPALSAAGLDTKIYGNDLSWDQLSYADGLASEPSMGDLAGIAWHCYFGSPTVMSRLQQTAPALDQIVDECSPEVRSFGTPELLISSLRNWASVVALWNIALDSQGGPKQADNGCPGCTGIVTIDEQAHTVRLNTDYYQLGQVSAFVQPGASRIDSPSFVTYGANSSHTFTISAGLDDVAFLNPDGSKVLVAYNSSTAPISFAVESDGSYFSYTIPSQAMTTFVWR
jgi:glucosylceramidase